MLKLARVRFLLADDAGAGKTIMAGLLLRELKLRGLVERTLIVCPANLTFQWQREMKDKFEEQFTKGSAAPIHGFLDRPNICEGVLIHLPPAPLPRIFTRTGS